MPKRLIMVTYPLQDQSDLDLIRAADPEAEVVYVPFMEPEAVRRTRAKGTPEEVRALVQDVPPALLERLPEVEIMVALDVPADLLQRAPKLRWIHNIGSGTDHYRHTGILESAVVLTSAKGIAARSIAEFVMAQLLTLAKRFPGRLEAQRAHQWKRLRNMDLHGRTLGIVGLGEIGGQVAPLARAFGMRVVATKRTVPDGPPPPNVDRLYRREELRAMLAECDAVVIAAAYTPETRGMVGAAELAALKPGALLMDVSRGGILEEEALIAALRSGHLGGAALDVFDAEPLPPDSPLWDLPNLVISAHNAVGLDNYGRATIERFVENLGRYLRGEPLRYVVDPAVGY